MPEWGADAFGGGYQAGYEASLQRAGQDAYGRTLQLLSQMQQPQMPPMAQGPQQIQGGPQMAGGQMPMPPQGPAMTPQRPPMGMPGQMPQMPPQMPRGAGGPPMGPGMGGGAGVPQQPMPPQQQPQMPPGPGGGMQQGPSLDWRMIMQKVQQANPGAPPQILAAAVDKFLPLMSSESQQQWRQVSEQLRMQQLQNQMQIAQMRTDTQQDIAQMRDDTTRRGQDVRAQTATDNRISRETIAAAGLEGRQAMFEAGLISKEQMDEANRNERGRQADQRADVQRQGITTRADTAAQAEQGRDTRSQRQADTVRRGQDIRADTAANAEAGRMQRAELSDSTKKELANLSIESRREIESMREKSAADRQLASEAGKDYRTSYQEGGRMARAQLSAETRKEVETMSAAAKEELAQYLEAGRMERSAQDRTSRENVATANREERKSEFAQRQDQAQQRIQQTTQRINSQREQYGLPPIGDHEAAQVEANVGVHSPARTTTDRIADQIVAGKRPPITTGLGMHGGFMVSGSLANRYPEFDQTHAQLEYEAARRTISGMTSPQQVKFQQLGTAVVNTFDKVIEDARKMKLSGITPLNKADIDYLVNYRGNTPAGKLAATYLQDVAFLKGEVANLENGGYAPTESSWEQAKNVINEDYGVDEMIATAGNAQRLIQYRLGALAQMPGGTMGVGSGASNRYLPPGMTRPSEKQDMGNGWSVQVH